MLSFYRMPTSKKRCKANTWNYPFNSSILMMPREDFDRVQKRHFPSIHNNSTILSFAPQPKLGVKTTVYEDVKNTERRHYCVSITASNLDQYM